MKSRTVKVWQKTTKAKIHILYENKMELISGKLSVAYFLLTHWNTSAAYVAVLSRATGNSAMDPQAGIVKCSNSRVDQDFFEFEMLPGTRYPFVHLSSFFWRIVSDRQA